MRQMQRFPLYYQRLASGMHLSGYLSVVRQSGQIGQNASGCPMAARLRREYWLELAA